MMRCALRELGLAVLVLVAMPAVALALPGTVHLKNGGWLQGEVMEVVPEDHVTLRAADGSVRQVPWAEVENVDTEAPSVPAPQPVAEAQPEPVAAPVSTPVPPRAEPVYQAPAAEPSDVAKHDEAVGTLTLFGFTGLEGRSNVDLRVTDLNDGTTQSLSDGSAMDMSNGFGGEFDVSLHRFFSLGVLVRASWWAPVRTDKSALSLDFAAVPRLRYPFPLGDHWGAVFFDVPVGVGYVRVPDSDVAGSGVSYSRSVDPAFVLGIGAGVQLMFSSVVGAYARMGWLHRDVSFQSKVWDASNALEGDTNMDTGFLAVELGLSFALW